MYFKKFLKTAKNYMLFVLALSAIGAVVGYYSAKFFPSGYVQTQIFFITSNANLLDSSNSEKYFNQENSRNFTDTAVAVLESGDFQAEILNPAQTLAVRKIAPQVIRLTSSYPTKVNDNAQLLKVADHLNQKIGNLQQSSSSAQLKPLGQANQPAYFALNKYVLLAGGFLIGALFAILILGLKVYLRL